MRVKMRLLGDVMSQGKGFPGDLMSGVAEADEGTNAGREYSGRVCVREKGISQQFVEAPF